MGARIVGCLFAVASMIAVDGGAASAEGPTALDRSSDPPIAIVVLVEGHALYLGGMGPMDNFDPPEGHGGIRRDLVSAFGGPGGPEVAGMTTIPQAGGPGSRGALLVYGDRVDVWQPMGDLRELTADKLGDRQRQRGVMGRQLVAGVRAARELLRAETSEHKILLVISDGVDPSATGEDVSALGAELAADGIDVRPIRAAHALEYVGDPRAVSAQGLDNLKALGRARSAKDFRELRAAIAEPLDHLHRFAVADRKAEVVRVSALAALTPRATAPSRRAWWWLAIPGALVVLTGAGLWLRPRRCTQV